jgi:hypothetical protein
MRNFWQAKRKWPLCIFVRLGVAGGTKHLVEVPLGVPVVAGAQFIVHLFLSRLRMNESGAPLKFGPLL